MYLFFKNSVIVIIVQYVTPKPPMDLSCLMDSQR